MPEYKITNDLEAYLSGIMELRSTTVILPDPVESRIFGRKEPLISNLDNIATTITHTSRPHTKHLPYDSKIPTELVLKRGYSDTTSHVLLPQDKQKRTWSTMVRKRDPEELRHTWFSQELVPSLLHLGEMRVFVIAGRCRYIMWTRPTPNHTAMTVTLLDTILPLQLFRCALKLPLLIKIISLLIDMTLVAWSTMLARKAVP